MTFGAWFHGLCVALDTACGAFFPRSLPGMTISARAATARDHGHRWGCILCRLLDWLDANHCDGAVANDIARAKAVIAALER